MPRSLFNARKGSARFSAMSDVPQPLPMDKAEQVSGGMRKVPGGPGVTVFYDDGINVLTSDPSKSNVVINYV
jgi:hypothetical protein